MRYTNSVFLQMTDWLRDFVFDERKKKTTKRTSMEKKKAAETHVQTKMVQQRALRLCDMESSALTTLFFSLFTFF